MKRLNIVIVIILVSLFCVVAAISGETILVPLQISKNQKNEKCSSEKENFKLCAALDEISIKVGEKTAFTVLVTNTGDNDITMSNQPPTEINVYDEKGNRMPTILEAKAREKKLNDDDSQGFINKAYRSHRYELVLKPQQSWKRVVKISDDYDLSKKGKYFVEVKVKLSNKQKNGFIELTLNKIEITVE